MRALEFGPASFLTALLIGLVAGACAHSDYRIEKVCKDYCARVIDCNDNNDFDDCVDDCIESANNCDSDQDIEDGLDILETCDEESCNDVGSCALDAWIECAL